jgi:hypothetical protein
MKKVFLLATAAFLFTGVTFANDVNKNKKKKSGKSCTKGGACCHKSKDKTAKL